MSATLAIRSVPDFPYVREVVVDCRHATTTAWMIHPELVGLTDREAVQMTLEQHARERPDCECIAGLWRRYGPAAKHEHSNTATSRRDQI